jgi:8-oxo-dGTP pyrophosphatase MutT (NUDIX family)
MLGESSFACCLRELREEIGLLSDEEEIENSPPISAALEDKVCRSRRALSWKYSSASFYQFCAFVLHPKHFVVGGRDHNLDETNLYPI